MEVFFKKNRRNKKARLFFVGETEKEKLFLQHLYQRFDEMPRYKELFAPPPPEPERITCPHCNGKGKVLCDDGFWGNCYICDNWGFLTPKEADALGIPRGG